MVLQNRSFDQVTKTILIHHEFRSLFVRLDSYKIFRKVRFGVFTSVYKERDIEKWPHNWA